MSNPNPVYTVNPNQALTDALLSTNVTQFIALNVSSTNGGGGVTNIGFEQQHANVNTYSCTYWLEALNGSDEFTQLQYSQSIALTTPHQRRFRCLPSYHHQHSHQNTIKKGMKMSNLTLRSSDNFPVDRIVLHHLLQQAVDVELFTIPLYMTSLYSIRGM